MNLLSISTNGEQENNLAFVSNEHDQPCNCSVRWEVEITMTATSLCWQSEQLSIREKYKYIEKIAVQEADRMFWHSFT